MLNLTHMPFRVHAFSYIVRFCIPRVLRTLGLRTEGRWPSTSESGLKKGSNLNTQAHDRRVLCSSAG